MPEQIKRLGEEMERNGSLHSTLEMNSMYGKEGKAFHY
jgi:hypothetical protein